jgi:phenylacetate-CoA ligase
MEAKLRELGFSLDALTENEENGNLKFPFLWIYGRRDFTISIMGANIYPEDIEQCVYADAKMAKIVRSFCQAVLESGNAQVRPAFYFEITEPPTEELRKYFAEKILEKLLEINADFKAAWHEYADTLKPEVSLFGVGEGPFNADATKIKQIRLLHP